MHTTASTRIPLYAPAAEPNGAMLILPDQQWVTFPFTVVHDGERLPTETMQLIALRTPGHTPESTCYLLEGQVLFTGDTLFPTRVGRSDLDASPQDAQACARVLYHSLHTLLVAVSDVAHPSWRASAVGVYRLWRDSDYAIGALLDGVLADLFGVSWAIGVIGGVTFLSGSRR